MHIKIDFKIFVFVILFCLTKQIEIYILLMIFAILHELGHLLAGIILNLKPKRIEINSFGLAITFEGIGENFNGRVNQKKIAIALAGPLVNLIIIFLAMLIPLGDYKILVIYANLILLLLNLLPIYPLDGGRILKNVLHMKFGYWVSCKISNKVSNIITILLTIVASLSIFYFKNIAILFIICYLWILMIRENKRYRLIEKAYYVIEKDNIILEKVSI